ncbi:peptidoglycan-binding protein [Kribbella sp. NPDC055110]
MAVRRRRAGRAVTAAVLVVAAGGVGAAAAGVDLGGHQEAPSTSAKPPATAALTRQTLVDTQTETGELDYGDATPLTGRLAGTVTAVSAVGSTIGRGGTLGRIDNAPIVLLYGALPAYRALSTGSRGADVEQFERNLYTLGYRGFTADGYYSAATAKAVKAWQRDLGLPRTGVVELGRVVYAAGPIRVEEHKATPGDAVQPGAALLTYTTTTRIAVVTLDKADKRLAGRGVAVSVLLPGGKQVTGKVVKVQPAAAESGQEETGKTVVAISIDRQQALAGLDDGAQVNVRFTVSTRKNVLSVPVVALLAVSEGGYGIQVVGDSGSRIVPVRTGLFAEGRVEVSGPGIAAGQQVGIPS